jgi:hypothetical protein
MKSINLIEFVLITFLKLFALIIFLFPLSIAMGGIISAISNIIGA